MERRAPAKPRAFIWRDRRCSLAIEAWRRAAHKIRLKNEQDIYDTPPQRRQRLGLGGDSPMGMKGMDTMDSSRGCS
jgi:hypothetical protein